MRSQHFVSVERLVIASLRKHLRPTFAEMDDLTYVNSSLNAKGYSSAERFKRDYVVHSFLRKWKGLNSGLNLETNAFKAWLSAEHQCFRNNIRLSTEASTGIYSVAPSLIVKAQRKVSSVLGVYDPSKIDRLCRFGNGATSDLRRGATHYEKYNRPTMTFDALPLACSVLSKDQYISGLVGGFKDVKIVDHNRMVMVPKNSKTHRSIAAEPTLNSYIQQGFGRYIRYRLKSFGVDLDDQTINQDLARNAQSRGLSTIDLSMASDTLCISLVKLLLPSDWFEALNSVRSSKTTFKGKKYLLEKFSSMGNAYTFELESLIFYALVSSACEHEMVSVYGDDIIVSNKDFMPVVNILQWAGFNVNYDKSFTEGSRFYESCGVHYFDGQDVTPCYQKDVCRGISDYVHLHNRLVRAGIRLNLREEFRESTRIVRDYCRNVFGHRCPGVGPLVEYDEYFCDESFVWPSMSVDRVRVKSILCKGKLRLYDDDHPAQVAYFGRKLRTPSFLNVDPQGYVSDTTGQVFILTNKEHWRSSSFAGTAVA